MIIFCLKLLLAHILGDFVFQSKALVRKRKENIAYLFLHVGIHALLLVLCFLSDLYDNWPVILFVSCSHLLIDSLKIWWERKFPYKPFHIFVVDQGLHLATIAAVAIHQYGLSVEWLDGLLSEKNLLYLLTLLLTVCVSPILLRVFFSRWKQENELEGKPASSLTDAGLLIGIMERLLIVLFIQLGFLSGIGFLLAAKSIFRFGDLTNARDTKFTEYILLGTLASFVIGVAIGFGLKLALRYTT